MVAGRAIVDSAHTHIQQVFWIIRDASITDVDELLLEHTYHSLGDEGIGNVSFLSTSMLAASA